MFYMFEESQSRFLRLSSVLPGLMVCRASPASRHFCSKGRFLEKCGTGQDQGEKTQDSNICEWNLIQLNSDMVESGERSPAAMA